MGLMIHSLAKVPLNAERDYYIYLLDYGWKEPIANTLRHNFSNMARLASETDSVVLMGLEGSHFNDEVLSFHQINGQPGEEILPAILITTRHPHKFNEENSYIRATRKVDFDDRMLLIPLQKICKSPAEVVQLIEKIFVDIKAKKALSSFQVVRELTRGKQGAFVDALILEPNIAGIGVNLNYVVNFLLGRNV
ncbi:MAG: hypothetical protein H6641_07970 [Caldilineaceae bacterium]|nr:hypothetical protein [Caldilineaceae bacterium]